MSKKEIRQAITAWNKLFEWTANKCNDESEGMIIYNYLNKILVPLKKHKHYGKIPS